MMAPLSRLCIVCFDLRKALFLDFFDLRLADPNRGMTTGKVEDL